MKIELRFGELVWMEMMEMTEVVTGQPMPKRSVPRGSKILKLIVTAAVKKFVGM